MKIAWWAKRDLRVTDNAALAEAVALCARHGGQILPVYCHEPTLLTAPDSSPMHAHAQCQAVEELRRQLRGRGADVYVATADALPAFEQLRRAVPFTHLFAHEETGTKLSGDRTRAVADWCRAAGVEFREFPQSSVQRGGLDRDRLQEQWKARVSGVRPLPAPPQVPMTARLAARCAATAIPQVPGSLDWQPVSETHGRKTLAQFLADRSLGYAGGISSPNSALHHGSRLSAHLAWGTLSVRQVYHATVRRLVELDRDPQHPDHAQWTRGLKNFLARLHWRDHFVQRLEDEPEMEFRPLHPAFRTLEYEDDPRLLEAFAAGQTGFPLVDAVMRCLAATGFVNFRMRAFATSFACHALHLDWRTVHYPLCRTFRDYEPGIHFSQLQMQAGVVGISTIRVYSPHKQLAEQDPRCRFVRKWVPELRDASDERIRAHYLDPVPGYVPVVVDFASRTRQSKDALFARRQSQRPADTAEVYRKHASRRSPLVHPQPARGVARRKAAPAEGPGLFG